MHIGNRIFPYPVLNRNEALSDYCAESKFSVQFDLDENGAPIVKNGEVIFKNLSFTITDESLIALIEQGKLKGAFIVECSASVYRSKFDISSTPYDLHVSAHEINGNVVASCYIYATEDIENFKSAGFISEYAGYSFDIDKFDILAVDDGYKFKIELDPTEDDKVASIFTIVKKEDESDIMSYDYDDKKIIVRLPAAYYDCYDNMKTKKECNNIAFAMIAIPALACCLEDIHSRQYGSIEEILDYTSDSMLMQAVQKSTGAQVFIAERESVLVPSPHKTEKAKVIVSGKRSLEAAELYAKQGKKVCVLNFASATNPGGGVVNGSSAQEECLCRCTTLYPCLNNDALWAAFYVPHRRAANPLYNNDCIYTPNVYVFKDDTNFPEPLPKEDWWSVNILTCAAPNLQERPSNAMNPHAGDKAAKITLTELEKLLTARIRRIFEIAVANGNEVLILGAFGCGAFRNPPQIVARVFNAVMQDYLCYFDTIEYAVYHTEREVANYEAFCKEMQV